MGLVDDAADSNIVSNPTRSYLGSWSSCLNYGYYNNGYISSGDYATTMGYNVGDVIGFELDKQIGELRFFKNGKQQGAGIKNPRFCDNSELYPALDFANVGDKMTIHKVTKKKSNVKMNGV